MTFYWENSGQWLYNIETLVYLPIFCLKNISFRTSELQRTRGIYLHTYGIKLIKNVVSMRSWNIVIMVTCNHLIKNLYQFANCSEIAIIRTQWGFFFTKEVKIFKPTEIQSLIVEMVERSIVLVTEFKWPVHLATTFFKLLKQNLQVEKDF